MKVGGKERRLVFNINALIELEDNHGMNVLDAEQFKSIPLKKMRAIAFVGLKHGSIEDGQEVDFTIEDVGRVLTPDNFSELLGTLERQNKPDLPGGEGKGESS